MRRAREQYIGTGCHSAAEELGELSFYQLQAQLETEWEDPRIALAEYERAYGGEDPGWPY